MSTTTATIDPERQTLGEVEVIGRDRWEEIRRRAGEGASIRRIARELDLDRKTMRRCLRHGVEAVPAGGAVRHTTGPARGVPAATGGRGRLLGPGSVPGAERSALPRQLRRR